MAAEKPADDPSLPPELARLPPGRHGLPRDFVAANHRDRLIAACVQEVAKQGYAEMTVADVIKTAAVSRRTFYEFFDSKEACFLATYDLVLVHVRGFSEGTMGTDEDWPHRVKATFAAVIDFIATEPDLARIILWHPVAAGGAVALHHQAAMERFARLLHADRPPAEVAALDESTQRATFIGIVSLLHRRLDPADAAAPVVEGLLPELVEAYLTVYLGVEEAERIARE